MGSDGEAEAEQSEVYKYGHPPVSKRPKDPRTEAGWNVLSRLLFT